MRRNLAKAAFSALFAGLLLGGCATPMRHLSASDNEKQVTVMVGERLRVELPGNRTTGYHWSFRPAPGAVLEPVGEPSYRVEKSSPPRVGAGGTELWEFRAFRPGRQTLQLEYTRPWEKDVAPAKVVRFEVTVEARSN